ncbi:MAG: hypothetical protein R6W78_04675 [Bacteroidales bacterium]
MGLSKGQTNNPAGRPRGSKNKATEVIRQKVEDFITLKIDEVETVWKQLEAKDKMQFLTKILDFVMPKLKATDSDLNININSLSDSELTRLCDELLSKLNEDEN